MDVSETHTYDASITTVQAMFADRDFVVAKYEGMGHREIQIETCEASDGGLEIRSSRVVEIDLPGFAKRFIQPVNTMVQTDHWTAADDGGWSGTFDVDVQGAPVHISGSMALASDGGACRHTVTMKMDVKVPLAGGRIADWAGKNEVPRTLAAEFAAGDTWLADHA